MKSSELHPDEFALYYAPYLATLDDVNLIEELEISLHRLIRFVQDLPMSKFDYRYELEKWTIKEILQHLIDTERIFCYRALRFSRNDHTELPGFEENAYIANCDADMRSVKDLLEEMSAVRHATLSLFKSFSEDAMKRKGVASHNLISVRALGFIIIGHQNHHLSVFQDRYL